MISLFRSSKKKHYSAISQVPSHYPYIKLYTKERYRGWRASSVNRVIAAQAWELEFDPQNTFGQASTIPVSPTSRWEAETGESLETHGPVSLTYIAASIKRPCLEQDGKARTDNLLLSSALCTHAVAHTCPRPYTRTCTYIHTVICLRQMYTLDPGW